MAKNNKSEFKNKRAQRNEFENSCGCNHHTPDDRKNRENCRNSNQSQESCNCKKQNQEYR